MNVEQIHSMLNTVKQNIGRVIVGKEAVLDRLLAAVLASGHVLLEDVPGTGKTKLAKALARSIGCQFKRIQFTPDLLPSDLSGIHYYNQPKSAFEFRPGPLFTNILLADEINRATPRTQSSLLECMEERQISVDGETMVLERPFTVIATQNPIEHQGTFPLPEAQLDRFLIKIRLGYPSFEESLRILKRFQSDDPLETIRPVAGGEDIVMAQSACGKVEAGEAVLEYIVRLAESTREHDAVHIGVSPRGCQALLKAAQAHALLQGRDYVIPDDVKAMAVPVLAHRLVLTDTRTVTAESLIVSLLDTIPVPTEIFEG